MNISPAAAAVARAPDVGPPKEAGEAKAAALAAAALAAAPPAAAKTLVKLGNGEYTAASVSADQKDAQALGLVKQKDGNYAAKAVPQDAPPRSAAAASSAGVQAALNGLTLGG